MKLLSLNAGRPRSVDITEEPKGVTGIDKRPVDGPDLDGPDLDGPDLDGPDLDGWERELGRAPPSGSFGENLTTEGLDVSGALIGERRRIGSEVVLEVTTGRVPCLDFQRHMGERGWGKRFTRAGEPGACLRVIRPGEIRAGDPIEIVHRPEHDITVALVFRALMNEHELLPRAAGRGRGAAPKGAGGGAEVCGEEGENGGIASGRAG